MLGDDPNNPVLLVAYRGHVYAMPFYPYDGGEDSPAAYVDLGKLQGLTPAEVDQIIRDLEAKVARLRPACGIHESEEKH